METGFYQRVEVYRKSVGLYEFGGRNMNCKLVNGMVMVRVGGGWMKLQEYIDRYGEEEAKKAVRRMSRKV